MLAVCVQSCSSVAWITRLCDSPNNIGDNSVLHHSMSQDIRDSGEGHLCCFFFVSSQPQEHCESQREKGIRECVCGEGISKQREKAPPAFPSPSQETFLCASSRGSDSNRSIFQQLEAVCSGYGVPCPPRCATQGRVCLSLGPGFDCFLPGYRQRERVMILPPPASPSEKGLSEAKKRKHIPPQNRWK